MENDKKVIAAISAVMDYIKTEEEILCMQAGPQAQEPSTASLTPPKLWGISGRQTMMQMRNLMQAKAFHR